MPASAAGIPKQLGEAPAAAVDLRGVAKAFRTPHGLVHAVRGVDLSVPRGETVALLGPNGAGKSTTLDMLLGLTKPDRGTVSLLRRAPSAAVREGRVGAMLQAGVLIRDVSVRELVEMIGSLYIRPRPTPTRTE